MPIIAKKSEGRPPVEPGTYQAVCFAIIDLGEQKSRDPKYSDSQRVMFLWEIPEERIEFEKDGRKLDLPRTISREFPLSLGGRKPTKLRTFLETWRGRKFTEQELEGFDVKNVLGANGLLSVLHNVTTTGTYANVDSISPLVKGMPAKRAELDLTYFTLSDIPEHAPLVWPETIPEWIRKKVVESAEYLARYGNGGLGVNKELGDDDIPF